MSGMSMPIVNDRLVLRPRAIRFTRYPRSAAARRTRSMVSGRTIVARRSSRAREAVAMCTPAASATSFSRGRLIERARSSEVPANGVRDPGCGRYRGVLELVCRRKRDVRRGDPDDGPVELVEALLRHDRRDLGPPPAKTRVLLDREQPT